MALCQPPRAQAQSTRFALTCLGTETGYTINVSHRWDNSGAWENASVAPGTWVKLMWNDEHPGEDRSPKPTARYDDDTTRATNIVDNDRDTDAAQPSDCEEKGKTDNFYERGAEL